MGNVGADVYHKVLSQDLLLPPLLLGRIYSTLEESEILTLCVYPYDKLWHDGLWRLLENYCFGSACGCFMYSSAFRVARI